jgi:hypothetical protein
MAWGHWSAAQNGLTEVWNRSPAGLIDAATAWIAIEVSRIDVDKSLFFADD